MQAKKVIYSVAVDHETYLSFLKACKAGKPCETIAKDGTRDHVVLRDGALYEKQSGRKIEDFDKCKEVVGAQPLTLFGKLTLHFGVPVAKYPVFIFTVKPNSEQAKHFFHKDDAKDSVVVICYMDVKFGEAILDISLMHGETSTSIMERDCVQSWVQSLCS